MSYKNNAIYVRDVVQDFRDFGLDVWYRITLGQHLWSSMYSIVVSFEEYYWITIIWFEMWKKNSATFNSRCGTRIMLFMFEMSYKNCFNLSSRWSTDLRLDEFCEVLCIQLSWVSRCITEFYNFVSTCDKKIRYFGFEMSYKNYAIYFRDVVQEFQFLG